MRKIVHKFISTLLLAAAILASGTAAAVTTICAEGHDSRHNEDAMTMAGMNHDTLDRGTMNHANMRGARATVDCFADCTTHSTCMDTVESQEVVRALTPTAKQVQFVSEIPISAPQAPLPEVDQHPATAPPKLQPLSLYTLRVLLLI